MADVIEHSDSIQLWAREFGALLPRGRAARSMIAEITGGLRDAEDAYVDAGFDPADARARAVADAGDVDQVAADCRVEIAATSGRESALMQGFGYAAILLAWMLLGLGRPSGPSNWISSSFQWIGVLTVIGAVFGFFGSSRAARRRTGVQKVTLVVGVAGAVSGLVTLAMAWLNTVAYSGIESRTDQVWTVGVEYLSGVIVLGMVVFAFRGLWYRRLLH